MSNCISGFVYLLLYLIIPYLNCIYCWKYDISEKNKNSRKHSAGEQVIVPLADRAQSAQYYRWRAGGPPLANWICSPAVCYLTAVERLSCSPAVT